MPFNRNTASKRLNPGVRQTDTAGAAAASAKRSGAGARRSHHKPAARLSASKAEVAVRPNSDGSRLAVITPISAKPSRQATTRV